MIPNLQYESTAAMRFLRLRRARLAFALAVLILGASAATSYWSIRRLIDAAGQVSHTHEVLDRLDDLLVAVTQAESASRGFDIAGAESFQKPFDDAVQSTRSAIDDL